MTRDEMREFLDEKEAQYNHPRFIPTDPISIPHLFSGKEDREIAGFLSATLAWGQRPVILQNMHKLLRWMDYAPHDFIRHHSPSDREAMQTFVHRTFQYQDLDFFLRALQDIYQNRGGLEAVFCPPGVASVQEAIMHFRKCFFSTVHLPRSEKHVANPEKGSSAKRLNMFLRWMVRKDQKGVDFGIWEGLTPAQLSCPLDVHSGRVARELGLLKRGQNDWKAVEELDSSLRHLDPIDPVRYDFALFGLGVFEKNSW